ncbi:MAG: branched-chain amino acid ABC transporter permease [Verrucomicrobiota bacterium]
MGIRFAFFISLIAGAVVSYLFTGHPEPSWTVAQLDDYLLNILILMGINVILAVSLNVVNGHTGQFSLGHAGFMAVGAYASATITLLAGKSLLGLLSPLGLMAQPCLFVTALLVGGISAALAGLLVGIPSLRLRGDYLAIVTLGFGEIIRVVINNTDTLGGARGLSGVPPYTTLGWTFGIAVFAIYIVGTLVNSTYGRGFLAVRDDEIAAEAMGINTTKYKVTAFTVGAFFAGLAGALYAHFIGYITPEGFNFLKSVDVVVMVILGGMGSTAGVTVAAIALTILNELLRQTEQYRMIIFALILIVLMIVRPQGLIGDIGKLLPRKKGGA